MSPQKSNAQNHQSKKNQTKFGYPAHWNLALLYQSPHDPQLEKDLKDHQEKRKQFAQKYQNRTDYLTDPDQLLTALTEYEQLLDDLNGARPLMYFHYLTMIDSGQAEYHAQLNKITATLTKAQNQLTFFPIQLGKIDQALQDKFLQTKSLQKYHYLLQKRFELAKFDLPEEQEKLLNLTHQTSHQMWTKGVEKSLNQLTVKFRQKQLPLSQASQLIPELPTKPRRQLHQQILQTVTPIADFAESELNAIITFKNTTDELRGFKLPYQESVLSAEDDMTTVQTLIDVTTKNFELAHRFYALKAKLLSQKTLSYADRSAKIDTIKREYDFKQAYQLVLKTLNNLDPEFSQIFQRMASEGQLDIFPKQGKVAGAFCSSSTNNPTYVLLNHTNDFNSVTTLAHEIGHAIHSELSKSQPVIYQGYALSLAETASSFFEQLVFEELIKDFSATEKLIALHNQIQDDINTVFRQVALFNFELELHQQVKQAGYLDTEQISTLLNKHMQNYLGPNFNLTKQDGLFFIIWPHIRYFFYTYTYAMGQLISKNLITQVKNDLQKIQAVKTLLSSGGKDTPAKLLQAIELDITQPDFFENGLLSIEHKLEQLEKLAD